MSIPSPHRRNHRGRFVPEPLGGSENPHTRRLGDLGSPLLAARPQDTTAIVAKLVELAEFGDPYCPYPAR